MSVGDAEVELSSSAEWGKAITLRRFR